MASFSTMPALNSAAPPTTGAREYDPEIKDMASYIHNGKIDSELAVSQWEHLELHSALVDLQY